MTCGRPAALAAAFFLTACGGGGWGETAPPAPPPPTAITPAEAVRLSAQSVMDLTALVWSVSFDVQNSLVLAPLETPRTVACADGGRTLVTRPAPAVVRVEHEACRVLNSLTFGGVVENEVAVPTPPDTWAGTVHMTAFSANSAGTSPRTQTVSLVATGSGAVNGLAQPLALQLSGLSARRSPSALGRDALLSSPSLRVVRVVVPGLVTRDLYALEGCVRFTATGLDAELCIDAGSRIGLVENVGTEQLTGRLRWNAGTPGGFDARLRITPGGAAGTFSLRIELDLDNNGSFEAAATLDRSNDIGLRL